MIDVDSLDNNLYNAIICNLGYEEDEDGDEKLREWAKTASIEEAFERALNWEGLIGYSHKILRWVKNLEEASIE